MKKLLRPLLVLAALLLLLVSLAAGYVYYFLPDVGKAPELKVEITPERVERGRYLATSVAVCIDCHSTRDWSLFSGPPIAGTAGKGGEVFAREFGFPGTFYARNITPYALSQWTDGEIFRTITTGVSRKGNALFPIMPYGHYGKTDKEDIYSIIAYIRSLPAITHDVAVSQPDFPAGLLMNLAPVKPSFVSRPLRSDTVRYGEYMANMAACVECHSRESKGQVIAGTEFGGGREFRMPGGIVRSANLTNHATGLANMSREQFLQRFAVYKDSSYRSPKLRPTDFNSPMPWTMYAGMTPEDLSAIYAYLRTVQPINNTVEKFTAKRE